MASTEPTLAAQAAVLRRKALKMRETGKPITLMVNGSIMKLNRLDPDDIMDEADSFDRMHTKMLHRHR